MYDEQKEKMNSHKNMDTQILARVVENTVRRKQNIFSHRMHRHSSGHAQHSKVLGPNDQQIEQTKIRWELRR